MINTKTCEFDNVRFPIWKPVHQPVITKTLHENNTYTDFIFDWYDNINIPRNIIEAITGRRRSHNLIKLGYIESFSISRGCGNGLTIERIQYV